jgi:hypothetical protein
MVGILTAAVTVTLGAAVRRWVLARRLADPTAARGAPRRLPLVTDVVLDGNATVRTEPHLPLTDTLRTAVLSSARARRPPAPLGWLDSAWFPWAWMSLWALAHVPAALVSWHFVVSGSRLLLSPGQIGGLHLYATHPELQMGPLTFLAAAPVSGAPEWLSGAVVSIIIAAAGPALLIAAPRVLGVTITDRQRGLAAGVLLPIWAELAVHYTHLDDALALLLVVAAMFAASRERAVLTALLLAASADAKPWALAFVPILLVLPRARWHRGAWLWGAGVAVAWLPFVIADPTTLHAGRFSIPNDPSSSLRVLGVASPSTPMWDRPLQVLLGVALGVVAVRRGRWLVVPVVAICARMLLDPGTYPYYTAGLVLATVLADLGWRRTRWPWLSTIVAAGLYLPRHLGPLTPTDPGLGVLRALTLLAVIAAVLGPDRRSLLRRITDAVGVGRQRVATSTRT